MLSAALAALGGAVIGYRLTNMTTEAEALFSTTNNLQMIIICLIGGVGTVWGPWIGAFILFGLQEALRMVVEQRRSSWTGRASIFALLIILVVLFLPRGVMLFVDQRGRGLRWRRASPATSSPTAYEPTPILRGAGRDQALRRRNGRAGRHLRRAARRDRRADRAERRGQDDAGQPDHRRRPADAAARSTFDGRARWTACGRTRSAGWASRARFRSCGRSPT